MKDLLFNSPFARGETGQTSHTQTQSPSGDGAQDLCSCVTDTCWVREEPSARNRGTWAFHVGQMLPYTKNEPAQQPEAMATGLQHAMHPRECSDSSTQLHCRLLWLLSVALWVCVFTLHAAAITRGLHVQPEQHRLLTLCDDSIPTLLVYTTSNRDLSCVMPNRCDRNYPTRPAIT